ncbi:matrixin family metalloprotease [Terrabacter sp. LjRoot27]|uniref:matrixin family metalloprotease n=1 Tax=Terrabacter sp. LjRoot27 TaxID=3342306 RepID=UPI003ED11FB8
MKRIIFVVLAAIGLAVGAAAPSQAAKPSPTVNPAYWGHWSSPALVYDATGTNTRFKVAEAVTEWRKSGWNVSMTTDATRANIKVLPEQPLSGAIGEASLVTSGAVITGCTVKLGPAFANEVYSEHMAIHELGHCGGLPHSSNLKSVMYAATSSGTAMTRPSGQDIQWMGGNY